VRRNAEYHNKKIRKDLLVILVSVFVAILLSRSGLISQVRSLYLNISFLDSFISGTFFTSLFTTPISIVAFADIAKTTNIFYMAFWGALGAVIGDLILFLFIKDNLAEDVSYILKAKKYKKLFSVFQFRIFRWLTPLVGAFVIASPLPDELGIAMMGFSSMSIFVLIPISFVMNYIGILLIGIAVAGF
jgi:hypothetical protein